MKSQEKSTTSDVESSLHERIHAIARSQMIRGRRRLGEISPDQEVAVERLLISTAERIYSPILSRIRRSQETDEIESVGGWASLLD